MKFTTYTQSIILTLILLAVVSCRSSYQVHQTEHLFLLPERIRITHPDGDSGQGAQAGSARVLSEQVQYTDHTAENPVSTSAEEVSPTRLDTSHVYALTGVTVVSRARFAPVREGYIDLDFAIHIPKTFLSDDYQICLTPEILHNDSLVTLDDVILRGKNFIRRQQEDYERYEEYVATIIDPSGYDTAFVNRRAVDKELKRHHKDGMSTYYTRWHQYQEYLKWKAKQQQEFDTYNIRQQAKLNKALADHDKTYQAGIIRSKATGQDPNTLREEYQSKRRKIIESAPPQRQITLATVPTKYREMHMKGIQLQDIAPELLEKEDTARIASRHLLQEQIAINESRNNRKQEAFKRMVTEPYRTDAHYQADIMPQWNFNYRYATTYPVKGNLKTLRLILKGYITAVDHSYYQIRCTDTLSYVISSMDELADGRLIANPEFTDEQRQEYTHAIGLLRNREYQRALQILNEYKDYNTALTLTCLGYDNQAYDLVRQLPPNAETYYLSAILCCRLKNEQEAIKLLKKACELDESKVFRAEKDAEISKLIRKYGLQDKLL